MNKRDKDCLEQMKFETRFIQNSVKGIDEKKFLKDAIIQHAVSMALITIGECANHLSDEFKNRYSEIEWFQIVAVRNIAAHGYWQIDMRQIWQALQEDLPELNRFLLKVEEL